MLNCPKIPESVLTLKETFYICENMTGTVIIDAMPTVYEKMFLGSNVTAIKTSSGMTHLMEAELLATKG